MMSKVLGMTPSNLSKIENGQLSLSYDKLIEVADRLEIDIKELFRSDAELHDKNSSTARLSIDRASDSHDLNEWEHTRYRPLANKVKDRLMIVTYVEVFEHELEHNFEYGNYCGERCVYILEGRGFFHSEFYETFEVKAGDCIYLDIRMKHSLTTREGETVKALVVTSSEDKNFMKVERDLASKGLSNIHEIED